MKKICLSILWSIMTLSFTFNSYAQSVEIRAYITDIDETKSKLESLGATFNGDYLCTEYIYVVDQHTVDLDNEFIRLRDYEYSNTGWDQKKVCIAHKKSTVPGASRKTVFSYDCDALSEAYDVLKQYVPLCSYSREGWEYHLNGMKIYIEDIQGINPSIEVIAHDRLLIDELFKQLPVESVVSHSLPYMVYSQITS